MKCVRVGGGGAPFAQDLHTFLQSQTQTQPFVCPDSLGCRIDDNCDFDVHCFNGTCKLTVIICRCYKQEFVYLLWLLQWQAFRLGIMITLVMHYLQDSMPDAWHWLTAVQVANSFNQQTAQCSSSGIYLYYNITLSIRSCLNPQGIVSMELISSNIAYI